MLEIGLFWLGILIVTISVLTIFLDAFSKNRLWAVVGLLLLVPLLAHVFLNWSTLNVRKSLYGLVIGALAILVSITGGALAHLPFLADHEVVQVLEENIAPPKDQPLPNQQQADAATLSSEENYDPLLTGSEYEDLGEKDIIESAKQASPSRANPEPSSSYHVISQEEVVHAVNKQIRISMNDGQTIIGKLTDTGKGNLLVESIVEGGVVGLSYAFENINSIEVLLQTGEVLYVPEEPQTPEADSADVSEYVPPKALLPDEISHPANVEDALEDAAPTAEETKKPVPEIIDNTLDRVQETPLGTAEESQE